MRSSAASGLLAAASLFSAISAHGTVRMDIVKNRDIEAAQLQKRGTVTTSLTNAQSLGLYAANVTVGTPAQTLQLQLDTGSSDVWVPSSSALICVETRAGCYGGTFTKGKSTTFQDVEPDGFNISYVDGSGASGDYFQDTFSVGGATLKSFEMGLATDSTIAVGIMGIGYANSEANVFTGNGTVYPNLVDSMVSAGVIPSQAYSLWLDDLQSSTGSILFGGVDTNKFSGNMQSINIYPSSRGGNVTSFTVAFTSLSATSSSGTDTLTPSNFAVATVLDSGTTLTLLPNSIAQLVFEELGATVDNNLGATVVPCSLGNNKGTLNFGFAGPGGPVVKVPMSELVLPLTGSRGQKITYNNGAQACQLGIQAAGNLPVLFGDTFLRSAYVVYDLVNNRIGIAQTNFDSTSSNIVPFASQGAPIPSATTATGEAVVTQTATGIPKGGNAGATASGGSITAGTQSTATGLTAASGFASAASRGLEPLDWSKLTVVFISMGMMLIGGGIFAL